MPTTLRYEYPIARKEHTCMWCGGKIAVGEQYGRQTLLYDGYLYEWKNHRACADLAVALICSTNAETKIWTQNTSKSISTTTFGNTTKTKTMRLMRGGTYRLITKKCLKYLKRDH